MFQNNQIDIQLLRNRAYNLRWASIPNDVIPLTAADPDFKCARVIQEAVENYTRGGYFSYAPAEGLPEFKEATSNFFETKRNLKIDASQIIPVDSAAYGIYLVCKTLLTTGDEAIIFDPVDFLFQYSIENLGARPVRFSIPPGTEKVDFSNLEKLITPRTKLICLCNPLNPTGKVFKREELKQLGEIAVKHGLVILSDEIWSDIVFEPNQYTSIASISEEIANHVITVSGFSKSYGLAGLRIGLVATTNKNLFELIFNNSLHQSTVHGANSLGQIAATAALNEAQDWLYDFVNHLHSMRDLVTDRINIIKGLKTIAPEGCYVSFVNITETGMSPEEFQKRMFEKAKVAVVPGLRQWFGPGADGYIRLSFATSSEILMEAINRIEGAL
jgi:aspartate/methionine/tyrosine aminotransferase